MPDHELVVAGHQSQEPQEGPGAQAVETQEFRELSASQLGMELLNQLGEPIPFNNPARGLTRLQQALARLHEQNQTPVIVVDDVHYLGPDAWLVLKSLTNQDMDSRSPALLVLLGARTEVAAVLSLSRLAEVKNRLAAAGRELGIPPGSIAYSQSQERQRNTGSRSKPVRGRQRARATISCSTLTVANQERWC